MKIKTRHLKQQLTTKNKELKVLAKQFKTVEKSLNTKKAQLSEIDAKIQLHQSVYNPQEKKKLEAQLKKLDSGLIPLREKIEQLAARLSRVDFDYTNPGRGFDESKVKGICVYIYTRVKLFGLLGLFRVVLWDDDKPDTLTPTILNHH